MIKRLGKFSLVLILSAFSMWTAAQEIKYVDAKQFTMVGKAKSTPYFYHRLDTAKYSGIPSKVKFLATFPAGLSIAFKTNSTNIAAKWNIKPDKMSSNMTEIAFKGLDLYIKRNGVWEFAAVGKPTGKENQGLLIKEMDTTEKECMIYLPLFSEVESLEIGVEASSKIEPISYPFDKKILIYGTSIVHGVGASRPGMTYPTRLSRRTGLNFIDLGFSGNAKMENIMGDCLADIDADAYIIDCIPNTTADQITERTAYMISTIRKKHPEAPIIVMQSIKMDIGNFNLQIKENLLQKDRNIKKEVELLIQAGMKKIYFIEGIDLIGHDHEGTCDGIHPNDLGFDRMLNYLEPRILSILKENQIIE